MSRVISKRPVRDQCTSANHLRASLLCGWCRSHTHLIQSRPCAAAATYQPGPTRIYQNPMIPSGSSNVAHPAPTRATPSRHQEPPSRPHIIGELAERAKQILGEDPKPFKSWLRIAENARRDAKSFQELGDLESAFVEYAKAAIVVLEKIPAHPDYRVLLSTTQRCNMGLVSYFHLVYPHNGGSVGHGDWHVRMHFRILHGCYRIQNTCNAPIGYLKSQP